jgi:hypothetical protein
MFRYLVDILCLDLWGFAPLLRGVGVRGYVCPVLSCSYPRDEAPAHSPALVALFYSVEPPSAAHDTLCGCTFHKC